MSSRYSRREILSVLPHTDQNRIKTLLKELSMDLKSQEILKVQSDSEGLPGFSIYAGVARGKPGMELSTIVDEAKTQKILLV